MIRVFSYRPEYFNNNGDQGNLEALRHFLKADISYSQIEQADFVLVGDASRAAMREFNAELLALVPFLQARLDNGSPTLIVGSSYEFFAPLLSGVPSLSYGERSSEFRTAESAGIKVKGYRNTELVSPDLFISGAFVMTTMYGPVLAKNPQLLKLVAGSLGLQVQISQRELEWIEKL